jgi:phosphatidate cytidylyltransferase
MLRQRIAIALLLLPPGFLSMYLGGIWYFGVLMLFFTIASVEYAQMMQKGGHRPAIPLVIVGVLALALSQCAPVLWPGLLPWSESLSSWVLVLMLTAVTIWHVLDYERGASSAATDWAITIAGIVYLGWVSGYFMLLRSLPYGLFWTFIVLPSIWLCDSGAYITGKRWGKALLAPRLSPHKTWAGFWGGIAVGAISGALFGWILGFPAGPTSPVNWLSGGVIGLVASVAGVLGDLGISMLKRESGVKDTSNLLGAHGGLLDRVDSWLIAGPVCYLLILLLFRG